MEKNVQIKNYLNRLEDNTTFTPSLSLPFASMPPVRSTVVHHVQFYSMMGAQTVFRGNRWACLCFIQP